MLTSKRLLSATALAGLVLLSSSFRGCGGSKAVTKSGLPTNIKTVAVPAFQNQALRYKIESRFTESVMREILRRGKGLRVQSETKGADAVVDGTIKSFAFYGVLLDTRGRARIFEVTITAAVTVRD